MNKRIYKPLASTIVIALLFAACTKSVDEGPSLSSTITLKGSSIAADQNNTTLFFSTDGGATFSAAPFLKAGQAFNVRVFDNVSGSFVTDANFFSLDWSLSSPKPDNPSSDTPGFTFAGTTNIKVSVVDKHCAFTSTDWTGKWQGVEVGINYSGGSTDPNNITADPTIPNRFHMDNWWGDGVDAYFDMVPSTTAYDQNIIIPQQTTSEGGVIAASVGSYDQCRGTFTLNCSYNIGGVYTWNYNFHR